jgi:hypothetical protein
MDRGLKMGDWQAGLVATCLWISPVQAAVLAECGASSGQTFIIERGIVAPGDGGWMDDGISGGSIVLLQDGDNYDIVFGDITGGTLSAKGDGAQVFLVGHPDAGPVILVVYPQVTELYQFDLTNGFVLWSQHKYAGLVDKAALFYASCSPK